MNIVKIFTDYRQFQLFLLGAFSGMPLAILYSTLSVWFKDVGMDLAIITTFAIARIFYSLKMFWAPIVDQVQIPFLSQVGRRKSWMVICAGTIAAILIAMGCLDPSESLSQFYILTIVFGFASATFDIAFDAYRIEKLDTNLQAMGAANTVFGYRIGCLISGGLSLYFADYYGWPSTFIAFGVLYIIAVLYILTLNEVQINREKFVILSVRSWKVMAIDPFADFLKRDYALIILMAVIFFKLGGSMLGVVAMPFYLELGFTKSEIASVVKLFGFIATIIGVYCGGYVMYRLGSFKGMIVTGIAQSLANASFIWLNHMGHDVNALMVAITVENIGSGMGDAAIVGYLSILCNKQFSATQYALLSSASGLFSHTIVVYGGYLVKILGWDMYFFMTIILAIPGLTMFYYLNKRLGNV